MEARGKRQSKDGPCRTGCGLLGGLTTHEIARAFLMTEPTVAQRIVRAKPTLAEKKVHFEAPRGDEIAPRLASVLAVMGTRPRATTWQRETDRRRGRRSRP